MKVLSAFSPQSFNPIAMSWVEWRPVVRSPKQLRLHPALDELGWVGVVGELNEAAGLSSQSVSGQILITIERDDSLRLWALAFSGFRAEARNPLHRICPAR